MDGDEDEALREELEAVESIYGAENIERIAERRIAIRLTRDGDGDGDASSISLQFTFPPGYPSAYPDVEVHGLGRAAREAFAARVHREFFAAAPTGDVLIFEISEWARREESGLWAAAPTAVGPGATAPCGGGGGGEDSARAAEELWAQWTHGERLCDRKSVFQAHIAPVVSWDGVEALMDALYRMDARVRSATHNIMAYRCVSKDGAETGSDFDDDGESQAGSRLLHLLRVAKVENALVVVTRHFGGVHLGPARFAHINNTARELLAANGYIRPAHR